MKFRIYDFGFTVANLKINPKSLNLQSEIMV
jgi:hypothetical protein